MSRNGNHFKMQKIPESSAPRTGRDPDGRPPRGVVPGRLSGKMKLCNRFQLIGFCLCAVFIGCVDRSTPDRHAHGSATVPDSMLTSPDRIQSAFENQEDNVTVTVKGIVAKILGDEHDSVGDDHQRFIVRLSNGQTVLIVHNIDIAPRVAGITVGSEVRVHGDYVWNNRGGLIHWTHHDPDGSHENGWILFEGRKFE
jgi:hypothetical protein